MPLSMRQKCSGAEFSCPTGYNSLSRNEGCAWVAERRTDSEGVSVREPMLHVAVVPRCSTSTQFL